MPLRLPRLIAIPLAASAASAVVAVLPAPALATFPGRNGGIAFVRGGDIWTVGADGSGAKRVTAGPAPETSPAWSADGSQLAFARYGGGDWDVYRWTVGGAAAPVPVTATTEDELDPAWTPDGRIAFVRVEPASHLASLWVAGAGGAGETSLAPFAAAPDWSPDGTEVAFSDPDHGSHLHLVDAAGAAVRTFPGAGVGAHEHSPSWSPGGGSVAYQDVDYSTGDPVYALKRARRSGAAPVTVATSARIAFESPSWSPDGTRIAFAGAGRLWTIAAHGGALRPLTGTGAEATEPAWRPLPQRRPRSRPRA